MKFKDMFKKKKYVNKHATYDTNTINKAKTTKTKKVNEPKIAKADLEVRTITYPTTTKTFERLDKFDDFIIVYTPKILTNETNITKLTNEVERLKELVNDDGDDNLAKYVWDSTNNTYTDVKNIEINKATKANVILYNGGYATITDILNAYVPNTSKHASSASKVYFKGSYFSMDDILSDYINITEWKHIVNSSNDFESFKNNLVLLLQSKGVN